MQRYINKVKCDIEVKKASLQDLESKEFDIQNRILRMRSKQGDGDLCRNCHLRISHTARRCEYQKCQSVFSCGEEKHHPGEVDVHGIRCSIKKLKGEIEKIERKLVLKEQSLKKMNESLSNRKCSHARKSEQLSGRRC